MQTKEWEGLFQKTLLWYLHRGSLNDGVQELVVLCHLLGSYNFWLAGVTDIVIQQGDEGCRNKHKGSSNRDLLCF